MGIKGWNISWYESGTNDYTHVSRIVLLFFGTDGSYASLSKLFFWDDHRSSLEIMET